jgi:Mg2+-importing ATPase
MARLQPHAGLSAAEAALRLARYGHNELDGKPALVPWRLAARQLESPLVLILVFGAALAAALGNWLEATIILAIVTGSAALGFVQEYRAGTAVAALRQRLALMARVVRDGAPRSLPAAEIVPGDIVLLSAGNLVPADARVLEATDFLLSEAALTGESFPTEKRGGEPVFLGTSVRSGTASVEVTKTGAQTAYGAIAARVVLQAPPTEFARGIRQFGYLLVRVMVVVVLFVLTVNQLLGRAPVESLLFAVALAVGLTPELLPAIVSVTLSRGAREMAHRGVIVRRLEAIEDLGSIDVLCTDKTGTLTEGVLTLERAVDPEGVASPEVERLAFLNAAFETGIDNPLDAALVAAGKERGLSTEGRHKVDEIPYDFIRKRLTIVVDEGDATSHLVITKGAFDNVLAVCDLDATARSRCEAYYRTMGERGFRVLALAIKRSAPKACYGREDESAMTLAGLLLFSDPPKPGVRETIRALAALGIRIKMISGDNRHVAAHLAAAISLDPKAMLTGPEITALKDEALWHLAARTELFVEVDPQQKERIVRALQRTGHAVGYLGDGINDAPALYAADASISVESAVDVARESADIVLLSRDLDVLRRGVEDGRRTFANTLKYISITTSANFGNMISMALAAPLLPFLPLAAKQILLNNFISDLPSMAISTDNVDPAQTATAQRWNIAELRRFMIVFGLVSTAFDLLTFLLLIKLFEADEAQFQTAWFVVSLLTELAVVLVLRTRLAAWRSRPSGLLLWTTLGTVALALGLPYAGALAGAFGFVALPAKLMLTALLVTAAYIAITEAAKRRFYRP